MSDTFLRDVIKGFSAKQKFIPSKYLYDSKDGFEFFKQILLMPEYYVNRKELEIIKLAIDEFHRLIPKNTAIIEIGAGDCKKIRPLFSQKNKVKHFIPIDISQEILEQTAAQLRSEYAHLNVFPVVSDFLKLKKLPDIPEIKNLNKILFFWGVTIGNFEKSVALDILSNFSSLVFPSGGLVISCDLRKDKDVIEKAYNDKKNVTAKFNIKLIERINKDLNSNIPIENFKYYSFFNEKESRVEMYLLCKEQCTVKIGNSFFNFNQGETIHTENSYKYSIAEFTELLNNSNFTVQKIWTDDEEYSAIFYAKLNN